MKDFCRFKLSSQVVLCTRDLCECHEQIVQTEYMYLQPFFFFFLVKDMGDIGAGGEENVM